MADDEKTTGVDLGVPSLDATAPGEIPPLNDPPNTGADDITPDFGAPKRRRRSKKTETPPPQTEAPKVDVPPVVTPEDVQNIAQAFGVGFRVIFQMVAAKRGEHWLLDEKSEQQLSGAWATALAPWLVTSSKYLPLAIAALATVGVVLPRWEEDNRIAASNPQPREVTPIAAPSAQTP